MSHHDKDNVPEKVQEAIFNSILQRPENHQCADCLNKSPTWASVEFGVFLCIGCSGIHRQLGPHITRVKSSKLDKWRRDQVEIMVSVGNKLANDYYEYKLPKGFKRLDSNANPEEFSRFVKDKYVKKMFAPPNYPTPVEEFLTNKKNGLVVDLSFAKSKVIVSSAQQSNNSQKESFPIVRKKSLSLENVPPETSNKQGSNQKSNSPTQPPNQAQTVPFDLLSDGDDIVPNQSQKTNQAPSSSNQVQNNNTQNGFQAPEPAKTGSAFEFDFNAIQKPQSQSQAQPQPQAQAQAQNGQQQGQFQGQNQTQGSNMPQQAQSGNQNSSVPDITKLYQQSTMYNNGYGMNQMNPMMMMNNGQYNMQQANMGGMYQQNGQGWSQNQMQGQWNGNMGMQVQMNNMMQQQQIYQNNFNQGFMQNNMYQQQQQFPQQQQFNYQMPNNGFGNQSMGYAQNTNTAKFY